MFKTCEALPESEAGTRVWALLWDMVTQSLDSHAPFFFFFFFISSLAEQILISSYTVASPKREHRKRLGRASCNLVVRAFLWVMDVESLSGRKISYTS